MNASFYRLPAAAAVRGWVRRAAEAPGFFDYAVKAPEAATHHAIPAGDAEGAVRHLQALRAVLEPLREAGLLGPILLQLAPRFARSRAALRVLVAALDALAGLPAAVEFRHPSWTEGEDLAPEAVDLLDGRGVALCEVDGPPFPTLGRTTGKDRYVRLHGRRAEAWAPGFGGGPSARYDYLYSDGELSDWARRLRAETGTARVARVYFNNHPGGKAVANAERLVGMLGVPRPPRPDRGPAPQRTLGDFGL